MPLAKSIFSTGNEGCPEQIDIFNKNEGCPGHRK